MSVQALFWAIEDVQGVTATEKLVLIGLANYADDQGVAHPALYTLERITGLTERGIRKTLRALEDRGIIGTVQRPGFTSAYRLSMPVERLGAKRQPGSRAPTRGERRSALPARGEQTPEQTPERTPEQTPERGSPEPITSIQIPSDQGAAAPAGTAKGRGKRDAVPLPEGWSPGEQGDEYARRLGLEPKVQLAMMRNKADANDWRQKDWPAFWRNWCIQAAKFQARRSGRPMPPVPRWADCAPAPRAAERPAVDPRVQQRLAVLTRWMQAGHRAPPAPGWLGTPQAATMGPAAMVADLDAWLAETAKRNGLRVPVFQADQPTLAAAE